MIVGAVLHRPLPPLAPYSRLKCTLVFSSLTLFIVFCGGYAKKHADGPILNVVPRQATEPAPPPGSIRLSAIVVRTRADAQAVLRKLNGGAAFEDVARAHSIGAGKDTGGDLGYFVPEDLQEELREATERLQVGHYSEVIQTPTGYFILLKTAAAASDR